MEEYTQ